MSNQTSRIASWLMVAASVIKPFSFCCASSREMVLRRAKEWIIGVLSGVL
jgi:hypothetical protein